MLSKWNKLWRLKILQTIAQENGIWQCKIIRYLDHLRESGIRYIAINLLCRVKSLLHLIPQFHLIYLMMLLILTLAQRVFTYQMHLFIRRYTHFPLPCVFPFRDTEYIHA